MRILRLLAILFAVLYPIIVFACLHVGVGWGIIVLLMLLMLKQCVSNALQRHYRSTLLWLLFAIATGIGAYFSLQITAKLFPVLVNALFMSFTLSTLFSKQPLIERFARFTYPELPEFLIAYCRHVTQVWVGFFAFQTLASLAFAWFTPTHIWAIYTGIISYVLIGLLIVGEIGYRRLRFPDLPMPNFRDSITEIMASSTKIFRQ